MQEANIELRHQQNDKNVRLYIIQSPRYGTDLSVYNYLYKRAKEYFPNLREEDIALGVAENTGFMDGHAVINFSLQEGVEIPDTFKKLKWETWFKW